MRPITFVLRKRSKRQPDWTPEEDAKVIRLQETLSVSEIAEHFENRSRAALRNRVWVLQQEEAKKQVGVV